MNRKEKQEEKFNKQMESYREGITEDLKNGRDVSAIISGYGFIYQEEHKKVLNWIKENINNEVGKSDL